MVWCASVAVSVMPNPPVLSAEDGRRAPHAMRPIVGAVATRGSTTVTAGEI